VEASDVQGRRSLRYIRLAAYFAGRPADVSEVRLTISEIEDLIGQPLPTNARFPSWWRNDEHKMHSRAWLTAGWQVDHMNVDGAEIVFTRGESPEITL
jgi:hypothetical protein